MNFFNPNIAAYAAQTTVSRISVIDGIWSFHSFENLTDTDTRGRYQADGTCYSHRGCVTERITSGTLSNSLNFTQVPEPSTLAIFALGMMGLVSRRYKQQ